MILRLLLLLPAFGMQVIPAAAASWQLCICEQGSVCIDGGAHTCKCCKDESAAKCHCCGDEACHADCPASLAQMSNEPRGCSHIPLVGEQPPRIGTPRFVDAPLAVHADAIIALPSELVQGTCDVVQRLAMTATGPMSCSPVALRATAVIRC